MHFFTSFTFSYLNRACALAYTLKAYNPRSTLWAVITDDPPPGVDCDKLLKMFDHIIWSKDLLGPDADAWLFQHNVVEACTGVKGLAAKHILANYPVPEIVYLDPDIAVFSRLSELDRAFGSSSILLTPHQLAPEAADNHQAITDNEIGSLKWGVYNLGFIGIKRSHTGLAFLDWWASRLINWCFDDVPQGLFTDQRWIDLVPALFDEVEIIKHPGYNVASWNLSRRTLRFSQTGAATVNGFPLRFFHFTKLGPIGQSMTERYSGESLAVWELWRGYKELIAKFTISGIPEGYWAYGNYSDGSKISMADRIAYRTTASLRDRYQKPFDVALGLKATIRAS